MIRKSYIVNRDSFFQKSYQILLSLVIFLAPSNLFIKLYEGNSYVNGLQIDYLITKLYLSDIPILLILIIWLGQNLLNSKLQIPNIKQIFKAQSLPCRQTGSKLVTLCSFAALLLIAAASTNPTASFWYLAKIIEFILFALFLKANKNRTDALQSVSTYLLLTITATLSTQSSLALYQYHTQHSLTPYYLTGETNITSFAGLAKTTVNGAEKTLPYGTTAHPNILAGTIVIYLMIILNKFHPKGDQPLADKELILKFKSKKDTKYEIQDTKHLLLTILSFFLLLASTFVLYLTHSLTAWLGLSLFVASYALRALSPKIKKIINHKSKIIILVILVTIVSTPPLVHLAATNLKNNQSLTRRDYLNQAAWNMFKANPLFGVGLNNFTTRVEEYSNAREIVRFVQPVHNLPLLVLAENGVIGSLLLFLLIKGMFKLQITNTKLQTKDNYSLLATSYLLPIILLDHYLLTNQTGLIILILSLFV